MQLQFSKFLSFFQDLPSKFTSQIRHLILKHIMCAVTYIDIMLENRWITQISEVVSGKIEEIYFFRKFLAGLRVTVIISTTTLSKRAKNLALSE